MKSNTALFVSGSLGLDLLGLLAFILQDLSLVRIKTIITGFELCQLKYFFIP